MAADLSQLGYDQFGNSLNSFPAQQTNALTQPRFDINQDWSTINTPMLFNGAITDIKINSISSNKILAGTITVPVNVGSTVAGAYVQLDGANNHIIVNDGTNNRIVIGSV